MESILESLENLNVSEECFEDIVGLVSIYLSEGRNLEDTVISQYYKGTISPDKFQDLLDKAHNVTSSNGYFHQEPKEHRNSLGHKGNQLNIKQFSGKTNEKRVEEFNELSPEEKTTKRTNEKLNKN